MLFDPVVRLVYEGSWVSDYLEPARRLYDNELVYVSDGRFQFELAGERQMLGAGAVIVLPPGVWHESRTPARGHVTRHCVHFDWTPIDFSASRPLAAYAGDSYEAAWVSPVPKAARTWLPLVTRVGAHGELREMIETMFRYFRRRHALGEAMLWPVLKTLWTEVRTEAPPARHGRSVRSVLAIRDWIDRHYAEPLDYQGYCRQFRLSPSHLCRAFAAGVGRTPLVYLTDVRLQHARRLLLAGGLNVSEVSQAVGIPDANYFSRLFRRKFGQSPTEYLADEGGRCSDVPP